MYGIKNKRHVDKQIKNKSRGEQGRGREEVADRDAYASMNKGRRTEKMI